MGTRGYHIYRHKGFYIYRYHQFDSYPAGLGLKVLSAIPRLGDLYKQYVEDTRQWLDTVLDDHEKNKDNSQPGEWVVNTYPPMNDMLIEWTYTIDLDYEVFHIDSHPMYALAKIPPDEIFRSTVQFDSYYHRACPLEFQDLFSYNWTAPAPEAPRTALDKYRSARPIIQDVYQFLRLPESLSELEEIRKDMFQILIGIFMKVDTVATMLRQLEKIKNTSQYRPDTFYEHFARIIVSIPLKPMFFDPVPPRKKRLLDYEPWESSSGTDPRADYIRGIDMMDEMVKEAARRRAAEAPEMVQAESDPNVLKRLSPIWLHPRLCLQCTTHLDDEGNLRASAINLRDKILEERRNQPRGTYFGVLCSFFHCVVIVVDTRVLGDNPSFFHTPALQLLPSRHATSPETPGLTALCRLGSYIQFDLPLLRTSESITPKTRDSRFPLEVWERITDNILDEITLTRLAQVSRITRKAAKRTLRWPHVNCYRVIGRLTGVVKPGIEKGYSSSYSITSATIDGRGEEVKFEPPIRSGCEFNRPAVLRPKDRLTCGDFLVEVAPGGRPKHWQISTESKSQYLMMRLNQSHVSSPVQGNSELMKHFRDAVEGAEPRRVVQPETQLDMPWAVLDGLKFKA